jgi:hypothetical protein
VFRGENEERKINARIWFSMRSKIKSVLVWGHRVVFIIGLSHFLDFVGQADVA